MTTVQEAIALIEECGREMAQPSLIPLWSQHETAARLAGESPDMFMINSPSWKAWKGMRDRKYKEEMAKRWNEAQERIKNFVGPTQVHSIRLSGESVIGDKQKYGGSF